MATESSSTELCLEAGQRPTEELVSLAAARGHFVFKGLDGRSIGDLLKIATAGGRWEGRLAVGSLANMTRRAA